MRNLALSFTALLAGCTAALATPAPDQVALESSATAAARARGPAALVEMLAQFDAMAPGYARDALALAIDEVAGQRYATTSRLYWYTDLSAAEAEAHARHVPILSLRMLGRLDEDLSCANSRLFRSTLYANKEVSAFLRDHFVLHWSSERPVPHVTIDFGDGRKLERTTTGNSAHYVLDEHGHVLDVLPGLYAPIAFRQELTGSLALADRVRTLDDATRAQRVVEYQRATAGTADVWLTRLAGVPVVGGRHRLLTSVDVASVLPMAQRAAMSKARMEVPDLKRFGMDAGTGGEEDVAAWATAGQIMYGIGDLAALTAANSDPYGGSFARTQAPAKAPAPPAPHVLDAASRALIERLHDAVPRELVATAPQLAAMIDKLEEHVVADTAQSQLRLRPQIARHIVETGGTASFEDLNAWVYAEVFKTPRSDAWLGLMPRTDFTGLPGDGVVMR